MTTSTTLNSTATSSSADVRVPILLTLLFWPAAICWAIFSPSLVDALVGVPSIFVLYGLTLVAYSLLVEVRDGHQLHAPRRVRHSHMRLSHS
jgi:hypothetical protein